MSVRLQDIAEAIAGIDHTLSGADLDDFTASWQMQRAVERGLEIISEASRALSAELKAEHPDVPWAQIAGIGNILRHEYHRVEPALIWNITISHLRTLDRAIKLMRDQP